MRIVHVCTTPTGAARRLHVGLRRLGVESSMFVAERAPDEQDPTISVFHPPQALPNRLRRRLVRARMARDAGRYRSTRPADAGYFFDDRSPHGGDMFRQLPPADLIHVHTMFGLVDLGRFFDGVPETIPVVRTLHDMSFFTGGCHQDWGCGRFRERCGRCPQLGSQDPGDLSRQIWRRKQAALSAVSSERFHLVAPSRWMAGMASESPLLSAFPITVIPLGLDTEAFRPRDRRAARDVLGIPSGARVALVVASPIARVEKGFALLAEALNGSAQMAGIFLLSVGRGEPPVKVNVPHRHLGYVGHEGFLSLVYSAADVVVLPSIQDTFPQAGLEALACGVPLVGFAVGGIPEVIRPGVTGVLVPPRDVAALGAAIVALLDDDARRAQFSSHGRRIATEEYTLDVQARSHVALYARVLAENRATPAAGRHADSNGGGARPDLLGLSPGEDHAMSQRNLANVPAGHPPSRSGDA